MKTKMRKKLGFHGKKIVFVLSLFYFFSCFVLITKAQVAPSSCDTGRTSGAQTGCTHTNDIVIRNVQCMAQYNSTTICSSIGSYLSALASDCNAQRPSGIDCSLITANEYYGREASKMAAYLQTGATSAGTCATACLGFAPGANCFCESQTGNCDTTGACVHPCGSGSDGDTCLGSGFSGTCSGGYCVPNESGGTGPGSGATSGALNCQGPEFEVINGVCYPANTGLANTDAESIITNILYWILGLFGLLAIIAFAISGIQYITSTGNEDQIETAKRNMTYSIIGVVVALSGLIIIYAIDAALSGSTMF